MDPGSALLRSLSGMTSCFYQKSASFGLHRAALRRTVHFALDHGAGAGKLHDGCATSLGGCDV